MKHKVSELEGALLDAAVLKCLRDPVSGNVALNGSGRFSCDWASGGPIIEREEIAVALLSGRWFAMLPGNAYRGNAYIDAYSDDWDASGPTPLIAAMRAYVASKFGDEVELP